MFEPMDARQEFEKLLKGRGLSVNMLNPHDGIEAMLDFYRNIRAAGCQFEADADMLLFQWGTYDWGEGKHFSFGLTRQLILSEDAEDDDIWQLSLKFEFAPNAELGALGNGDKWCQSLQDLPQFQEYVHQSAPLLSYALHRMERASLEYSCVG